MDNIRSDADKTPATSKRHHFELAATYHLLFCPVLRKFPSGTKCDGIKISDTTASEFGTKPSIIASGLILSHRRMSFKSGATSPSGVKQGRPKDKAKVKEAEGAKDKVNCSKPLTFTNL
eukprot:3353648-Ditylum_brightwellii.AAC.1